MSILVADDDPQLATILSKLLESEGYSVHTALDESRTLAELNRQNYKLIILDLNFGKTDGLQLLAKLRAGGDQTPVIVLSGRNAVSDRIQSLNLGADDYVTKPFTFHELAARAKAVLRRKSDPSLSVLRVEDLELDPAPRRVHRGKRQIKLSPKEFGLLQLLMSHAGETVSRQTLLQETWGTHETDSNLVDVYVNYLRKKVDSFSAEKLIQTVRGVGYRMGRPAPTGSGLSPDVQHGPLPQSAPRNTAPANGDPAVSAVQSAVRQLIHLLAHDLVTPLTTVSCSLEMIARHNGTVPTDLKNPADRAIALSIGVRSLASVNSAPPAGPWISVEQLFTELLKEFAVVINAGQLTVERHWDVSAEVTSNPVLRQLLAFFISKIGGNGQPLTLTITARAQEGLCDMELRWQNTEHTQRQTVDAVTILDQIQMRVQEIVYLIGGELALLEGQPQIRLKMPAPPRGIEGTGMTH